MTSYTGSCHCGAIRSSVSGTIGPVIECNCSMCSPKGSLLWFVPRSEFRLETPEKDVSTYKFNKHVIEHKFCANCGIGPYALGRDPKGNEMAAINVRCLEGVDLQALQRMPFDGRSR
jgi:hypothetical protein